MRRGPHSVVQIHGVDHVMPESPKTSRKSRGPPTARNDAVLLHLPDCVVAHCCVAYSLNYRDDQTFRRIGEGATWPQASGIAEPFLRELAPFGQAPFYEFTV